MLSSRTLPSRVVLLDYKQIRKLIIRLLVSFLQQINKKNTTKTIIIYKFYFSVVAFFVNTLYLYERIIEIILIFYKKA